MIAREGLFSFKFGFPDSHVGNLPTRLITGAERPGVGGKPFPVYSPELFCFGFFNVFGFATLFLCRLGRFWRWSRISEILSQRGLLTLFYHIIPSLLMSNLEAPARLELAYSCFADSRVIHLHQEALEMVQWEPNC